MSLTLVVAAILLAGSGQVPEPAHRAGIRARPIGRPTAELVASPVPGEQGRFEIRITPRDSFGKRIGPGRADAVELTVAGGRLLGELEDAGEGLYRQRLELAPGTEASEVELEVSVLGVAATFPLAEHLGAATRVAAGLEAEVARARADLAHRLALEEEAVRVVDAERVTWRDASAGCPRPGVSYPQVLTPGLRIRLRALDTLYAYHAVQGTPPTLCESPQEPVPTRDR